MAKLLQISQLGNKVLRKKTSEIIDINSREIQDLIDDLMVTVRDANGVGIACPQVYESKRLFVVSSSPNIRYPNASKIRPLVVINPKIIFKSEKIIKDWEGCLSIPGIRGLVNRYKSIGVSFLDRNGVSQEREFSGFISRVFQHEFDHLNGIMFIDRIKNTNEIFTEKEYNKLV